MSMPSQSRSVCALAPNRRCAALVAAGLLMLSLTGCCELFGICDPHIVEFRIENQAPYAIDVKQQSFVNGVPAPQVSVAVVTGGESVNELTTVQNPEDFVVIIYVGGGPVKSSDHLSIEGGAERVFVRANADGTFLIQVEPNFDVRVPWGAAAAAPCSSCPTDQAAPATPAAAAPSPAPSASTAEPNTPSQEPPKAQRSVPERGGSKRR